MSKAWQYQDIDTLIRGWRVSPPPPMETMEWIGVKDGFTPEQLAWDNWGLNENSIVFEIGGHNGRFTEAMLERYSPTIYFFEPAPRTFEFAKKRLGKYPNVKMFDFGLGNRNGTFDLGDASKHGGSFLSDNEPIAQAKMVDIAEFFAEHSISHVDFMQINAEGAEFFLLPHMINAGILDRVERLMLHWHSTPLIALYQSVITAKMLETHRITRAWTFQCWEKRKQED